MLWQLKKISTNTLIGEPGPLPENWGPIFGMANFKDKLGDLTWLGDPELEDMCWVEVPGEAPATPSQATPADLMWEKAKTLLKDSDWTMLSDVPLTAGQKTLWEAYRKALREVRLQSGFPDSIIWPDRPV